MPDPEPGKKDPQQETAGSERVHEHAEDAPQVDPQVDGPSTRSGPLDPRRRLVRSITRPGRGQIIAAVMLFVVAVAGIAQVRSKAANEAYSSARQDDLVQILDGLNGESRRLESEVQNLERTRQSLRSGADRERVARSETQQRVDDLGILAGTVRATGPGVEITVKDPAGKLGPELLLEGIEELRDAGAEAIEINGKVRVVASTSFAGSAGALTVDRVPVKGPVVIEAIGDADSLASGASFRGGFVDQVTGSAQGSIDITKQQELRIDSLHTARENQYAHPASSPTGRR
ncbi:DUF881 domain-containing protein [Microlunatus soli]|uniref:Uncharacterized conserved protein YlxW, UPF0749 family n=1 Tax=Microlunatus soli TaxID=630515 RepID=A0A1H2AMH0_9ACTN|nr:DUF881 domain-containing protein [Microlunatus soli]SDT47198.1 Uncharacterized conserved protein YlxW, UPF0749 family [Microlunatus soli]